MNSIFVITSVLLSNHLCQGAGQRCQDLSDLRKYRKNPVCGTDGRTYFHKQELINHNCLTGEEVTIDYNGVCDKFCGYIRPIDRPVCGSDGVTYKNQDALNQQNCLDAYRKDSWKRRPIIVAYVGTCKAGCDLKDTKFYQVCGTDGKLHSNKDAIRAYNCAYQYLGEDEISVALDQTSCLETCHVHYYTDDEYGPRCGSDGKTYFLDSDIYEHNCKEGLNGEDEVRVLYKGYCLTDCPNAPNFWDPICGDDGRNYENKYVLNEMNCINLGKISDFVPATVSYPGRCDEKCPPISKLWDPVCGSDRVTYENISALRNHNCINKVFGKRKVSVVYKGECLRNFKGLILW